MSAPPRAPAHVKRMSTEAGIAGAARTVGAVEAAGAADAAGVTGPAGATAAAGAPGGSRPRSLVERMIRFLLVVPRFRFDVWHRLADAIAIIGIAWIFLPERPWLTAATLVVAISVSPSLYRHRLTVSVLDDLPRVVAVGAVLSVLGAVVSNAGMNLFSLIKFTVVVVSALVVTRIVVAPLLRWSRSNYRAFCSRTLIVGTGQTTLDLARTLKDRPELGLSLVALVDAESSDKAVLASSELGIPLENREGRLVDLIRQYRARTVIIGFGAYTDRQLLKLLWDCDHEDAEVFIIPRLFDYVNVEGRMERINALPLICVKRSAHRSLAWRLKRPMDIVLSGIALVVLAPLFLLVALAVKLDGWSAPVLFRQIRIGEGGREFELLKFRSMKPADENESRTRWSIADDPRISPLGSLLRKTSLDEIPQIYNVFRGDMALVGPRPERPHFVERFSGEYGGYAARHRVPVGLTGWAAINGLRGDTSIADRVMFDNFYIENWSPWMDIRSILLTLWVVAKGTGK